MALSGAKYNASLRIKGNVFSEESAFQQPVLDIQTDAVLDPGAGPSNGDRYILTNTAALNANFGTITGVGDGDVVEYDGSDFVIVWDASAQGSGATAFDKDSAEYYTYNGSVWSTASSPAGGDGIEFNGGSNRYDLDLATSSGLELTAADGSGELQIAALGVTEARIAAGAVTDAKVAAGIDAAKLADGSVSNAEFQFINSLSSNAQDQIDSKQSTSEKGAANGYASLDANSKIPSAQLPAIAITDVFSVADITARDALTVGSGDGEVQEGDVALVIDASADAAITSGAASYIYNGASWSLLKAGDEVLSVNGNTGVITVNAINELTGDITAGPASGSASAAATIAAAAVTEAKIANGAVTTDKLGADAVDNSKLADDAVQSENILDDAVTSAKINTDAVASDALDFSDTGLRSGALTDPFTASLTRTFTHNWSSTDVIVEVIDSVTGETCFVDAIVRTSNAVAISLNQTPENSLRVLLREVNGSQTTLVAS